MRLRMDRSSAVLDIDNLYQFCSPKFYLRDGIASSELGDWLSTPLRVDSKGEVRDSERSREFLRFRSSSLPKPLVREIAASARWSLHARRYLSA